MNLEHVVSQSYFEVITILNLRNTCQLSDLTTGKMSAETEPNAITVFVTTTPVPVVTMLSCPFQKLSK